MLRRIPLGQTMNLRDLGGYATKDGRETAWGRHYRSAIPFGLSADDLEYARSAMGITTVIDLRTQSEAVRQPCAFAGAEGFDYRSIPLFSDYDIEQFGAESYFLMAAHLPTMSRLFRTILDAEGAVLFHCTAGKDRTGITAAILLMLAGVDDLDIIADYQVTQTYIKVMIDALRKQYPDMPQHAIGSPVEYITGFLERFRERWPSPEEYFRYLGFADSEIARLKARAVE